MTVLGCKACCAKHKCTYLLTYFTQLGIIIFLHQPSDCWCWCLSAVSLAAPQYHTIALQCSLWLLLTFIQWTSCSYSNRCWMLTGKHWGSSGCVCTVWQSRCIRIARIKRTVSGPDSHQPRLVSAALERSRKPSATGASNSATFASKIFTNNNKNINNIVTVCDDVAVVTDIVRVHVVQLTSSQTKLTDLSYESACTSMLKKRNHCN